MRPLKNLAPYFEGGLQLQEQIFTLSSPNQTFIYHFPAIVDPEDKKVTLKFDKLEPFMKFNNITRTLTIEAIAEGDYKIQTFLEDEDGLTDVNQL